MSQVPEEPYTLAEYRNAFKKRFEFTNVTVLGSDANGTHFQWDDARGERHFGVLSDLVGPSIVRRGSSVVAVVANGASGSLNVALSPALPGVIADYLVFTTNNTGTTGANFFVSGRLTTLSNLNLLAVRPFNQVLTTVVVGSATDQTVSPEPDTGHDHGLTDGAVAFDSVVSVNSLAINVTVSWAIILA